MEKVGSQVGGASASDSGSNYFTPLLISMAGIVCTTLAIVAYHFMVVRFCLRRRQRLMQMQLQASLSQQPISQSNGVDEKVLNSIPILSYTTKNCQLFRLDQSECVICLGELEDGDLVRLLPNCKHVFHNPCIDKWFLGHTNCPVCRSAIAVPIASVASLPVENDRHRLDHDQVRDREVEAEAGVNYSAHPRDPEQGVISTTTTTTTITTTITTATSIQLPKPNGLLRHCVSLVVLPIEGNNTQQIFLKGLERSLSLDQSHILIDIQRESDEKPSSSSSSSTSPPMRQLDCLRGQITYSHSSSSSSKPVLTQCGSFKARSIRQLDRMSSVLVRSLSQLRMVQSSSTSNGQGVLPC